MRLRSAAATLFAASFIFVLSLGAQAAAATPDLGSRDWSVSAKPNLATKPPSEEVVQSFITKRYFDRSFGDEPSGEELLAQALAVDSFAFADLHQSGTLSLVVSMEPTGPAECGEILIVDKVGEKFKSAWIDCAAHDIGKTVIEVGGRPVVVGYAQISSYNGTRSCLAIFPVIYGWNGSAYADMSRQFPDYYRKTLQDLQHKIAKWPATADFARDPAGCDRIEADAIERFLGSPDAGIEDAIRWSQSSSKLDRIAAVNMFSSVGTPRALDYLKAMTEDSDPEVARLAEYGLTYVQQGPHPLPLNKVYTGP
jgi:hypothetical protein